MHNKKIYRPMKEIIISTHYGADTELIMKDTLIIDRYGISYKSGNIEVWKYISGTRPYTEKYNKICDYLNDLFVPNKKEMFLPEDKVGFNICICYDDDLKINMTRLSSFAECEGFYMLTEAILELIPEGERYSPLISVLPLRVRQLNKMNFDILKYKEMVAFMFSESGAMGEPGEFNAITRDNIIYKTNFIRKNNEFDWGYIKERFKIVNPPKDYSGFDLVSIGNLHWMYIDLGMGNHLYIEQDSMLYQSLPITFFSLSPSVRYKVWKNFIKSNIIDDVYMGDKDAIIEDYLIDLILNPEFYVTSKCWHINSSYRAIYLKKDQKHQTNPLVFSIVNPDGTDKFYFSISVRPQYIGHNNIENIEKFVIENFNKKLEERPKTGIKMFDNQSNSSGNMYLSQSLCLQELSYNEIVNDMYDKKYLIDFINKLETYTNKFKESKRK